MGNKKLDVAITNGRNRLLAFQWKVIAAVDVETYNLRNKTPTHDTVHGSITTRVTRGIPVASGIYLQIRNHFKYDNT